MNFFVGRVLYRSQLSGIRHSVFLRNVLETAGSSGSPSTTAGEGVEMEIELYSPRVHKVTVLRLERWLDQDLLFLRNADPRMCTIPLNMQVEIIAACTLLHLNTDLDCLVLQKFGIKLLKVF